MNRIFSVNNLNKLNEMLLMRKKYQNHSEKRENNVVSKTVSLNYFQRHQ